MFVCTDKNKRKLYNSYCHIVSIFQKNMNFTLVVFKKNTYLWIEQLLGLKDRNIIQKIQKYWIDEGDPFLIMVVIKISRIRRISDVVRGQNKLSQSKISRWKYFNNFLNYQKKKINLIFFICILYSKIDLH